jgi:hypothetical protein
MCNNKEQIHKLFSNRNTESQQPVKVILQQ